MRETEGERERRERERESAAKEVGRGKPMSPAESLATNAVNGDVAAIRGSTGSTWRWCYSGDTFLRCSMVMRLPLC
ncbi:hypothetical protein Hdeb2414_s0015g00449081 [Helianthus debilis subsp. tardiflorus]